MSSSDASYERLPMNTVKGGFLGSLARSITGVVTARGAEGRLVMSTGCLDF